VQADATATVVTAVTPRRNVRDGRAVILDPPKATVILYAQPVPRRQLDPSSLRLLALSLFFSFFLSLSLSLSLFQKRKITARINRRRKTPFDTQFVGGSILLGRESILQDATECNPWQSRRIRILHASFARRCVLNWLQDALKQTSDSHYYYIDYYMITH